VSSLAVPVATKALVAWVCAQPAPAVAYEAGPTGYELARALHAAGVRCLVAAPSRVPRAPGDRVKTDRRDAVRLARLLRLEELVAVRVPSLVEEAARDLVRAREDARGDLMRARHRLSKLLLRRGIVWEERAWTQAHELWLSRQRFCERPLQVAYEEALAAMVAVRERRDALDAAIAAEAAKEPWAPVVARLACLRGVSTLTSCCAPGPRHRLLCARSRKMPPRKRCPCPCCGASVTTRIRRAGRESTSNGEGCCP
jgi:transposase